MIPQKIGLFLIDTLRYDCLNYLQDKKHLSKANVLDLLETPTLDSICNESVCFSNCYSTSSATVQVVTSMFTGISQAKHGMVNNGLKMKRLLDEKFITMAEILEKEGYLTVYAAETSKWFKAHKLLRGFNYNLTEDDKKLFDFLEKNKDEKIFLYAHFEDIHAPYLWCFSPPHEHYNDDYFDLYLPMLEKYNLTIPKEPTEYWYNLIKIDSSRKIWLPIYIKGVTKFDKGRFQLFIDGLKRTNFLDKNKSLLVITSDHGDGKYKNKAPKVFNHNGDPFDEIARSPLIVRLPNQHHEVRNELVSNIDIFKIILDLCTNNKTNNFINYKLDCINPFKEKRSSVWHMIVPELYSVDPIRYSLLSRTIITKNKKFLLRGKPETFLDPKVFDLSNEEFVLKLYLDLLVRDPTNDEIKNNMEKLTSISKKELFEQFLESNEYKKNPKWLILDRENDPFEEKFLEPSKNESLRNEYLQHFNELIDLDRANLTYDRTEESDIDENEIEEIEKELHKLGYI